MDVAGALMCVASVAAILGVAFVVGYWGLSIQSRYPEDDE